MTQLDQRNAITRNSGAEHSLADTWLLEARIAERRKVGKLADQAAVYFRLGFNVVALEYGHKRPPASYPLRQQYHTRFSTEDDVRALFSVRPLNIGVILGETSGNLAEIDCDDTPTYERVFNAFLKAGIDPWVWAGKRGGKFLFCCSEGELRNRNLRPDLAAEIRGNQCLTVLPPSVHPDGPEYTWILHNGDRPPMLTLTQIQAVIPQAQLKRRRNVSALTAAFLSEGAEQGERNNRLYSAACDMAGNGFALPEAESRLLEGARRCTPPMNEDDARKTIASAFSKARKPAQRKGSGTLGKPRPYWLADAVVAYVNGRTWKGRTGHSDRAVMLAMAERARRDHTPEFRASVREVAELGQMGKNTASRSLERLTAEGLIQQAKAGKRGPKGEAAHWRFTDTVIGQLAGNLDSRDSRGDRVSDGLQMEGERCTTGTLGVSPLSGVYCTHFAPFADLADVVGKPAHRAFVVIHDLKQATIAQICEATGFTQDQVKRALNRLLDKGLIKRIGRGLYEACPERADELMLAGAAKGHHRKAAHTRQRYSHLFKLAYRAVQAASKGKARSTIAEPTQAASAALESRTYEQSSVTVCVPAIEADRAA